MNRFYKHGILQTLGGLCALLVVNGIGRFVYTSLLPGMMAAYSLDTKTAGSIAAWNLFGYLIGLLAMRNVTHGTRRYALFVFFFLTTIATIAAMGFTHQSIPWHVIRFVSGVAAGACFVLCSSIVLDTLMVLGKPALAGFLYSGVGAGLALGAVLTRPFEAVSGPSGAWLWMALVCVPPGIVSLVALRPKVNLAPTMQGQAVGAVSGRERRKPQKGYAALLASYALEGFGYIIGMTFLVTLVQTATNSPALAGAVWIIAGVAAAISAPLWRLAARKGYLAMLILALTLQAVGALLPALSTAIPVILLGGLLLGGTFMGIVVLAVQYGVSLSGRSSAHTVAILTGVYGVGQIIGPYVAGASAQGSDFRFAFALSSASLVVAALLLIPNYFSTKKPGR